MKVLVLFDTHYAGEAADAVWIIDSAENRKWFEDHADSIDHNSAIFNADNELITILWHVFDHHPLWTDIVVQGQFFTREIAENIATDVTAIITEGGFRLSRP